MTDDPRAVKSLKAYYKISFNGENLPGLLEAIEPESDRAAVVIFGSILEDALAKRLRERMTPYKDAAAFERLFNFDGPLGSFGAKIDMACALRVIEEITRERLHLFREMRNACAHSMKPISLQTPQLWNVFLRIVARPLHLPQVLFPAGDWDAPEKRRNTLQVQTALLAQIILMGSLKKTLEHVESRHKLVALLIPSLDTPQSRSTRPGRSDRKAKAPPSPPKPSRASPRKQARDRKRKKT
jgi:hypothetical protein